MDRMAGGAAIVVRTVKDSVLWAIRTVAAVTNTVVNKSEVAIGGAATIIEATATVIATLPAV